MPTINRKKYKEPHSSKYYQYNNQSAIFYSSPRWSNLRNYYIKHNPLCEECLKNGIVTPAEQVHHKVEFLRGMTEDRRWELFLDEDNLMSVCKKCHHDIHNARKKDKTLQNNNIL